ncbi:MAG TPA: 50S ribosomal protein L24 [Bacillota bacterium]|nr:50S ribosomal protein L24 [Fastidiosipila sp.]HPX93290.1 50S ribosomal protein L24 [Bacillota bacterium]HQB80949.1 50S ribosomal protein L24 [Bacillota bacterium]
MPRNKLHVKVDDQVYVLTGKDAGKTGKIIAAYPAKGRVIVEGVNIATRHVKPRSQTQQGGIIRQEMPIDASNVMLVCQKCKRPSKTGRKYLENGDKVRFCKSCGATISVISKGKKE